LTSLLFNYALHVIVFVIYYTTAFLILHTHCEFFDSSEFAYLGLGIFHSPD